MLRLLGTNKQQQDPQLLRPFQNYQQSHKQYHPPHSNDTLAVISTILHAHHFQGYKMVKSAFKGALIGTVFGIFSTMNRYGIKRIYQTRRLLNQTQWASRTIFRSAGLGSALGLGWYFWHHNLFFNHHNRNYTRYYLSYISYGAIVLGLAKGPSFMYLGCYVGLLFGMMNAIVDFPPLPKGFEYKTGKVSDETRRKLEFEDNLRLLGRSSILYQYDYILPELRKVE